MWSWIQGNWGSVLVVLVLLLTVALIVRGLILDKKAGKHICGGCPMQGQCHSRQ